MRSVNQNIYPSTTIAYNDTATPINISERRASAITGALPWWNDSPSYHQFSAHYNRDNARQVLTPSGKELVDSLLTRGQANSVNISVLKFGAGNTLSNDMFFVRRKPEELGKVNIALYMPENDFHSFYEFKDTAQMREFFKKLTTQPMAFKAFLAHFESDAQPNAVETVREAMNAWAGAPPKSKAAAGGYALVLGDIFQELDSTAKKSKALPPVNGLYNIQATTLDTRGFATFAGTRYTGESVIYQYDSRGNLLGADDDGNYYFLKGATSGNKQLVPLTLLEFYSAFAQEAIEHVYATTTDGLYDAIANFLEHPFSGVSALLQTFGVDKVKADTVERSLDNPVTSLLTFLNKHNHIGKVFGLSKAEMDEKLTAFGERTQDAIPIYGQIRAVTALIGKAMKNEAITVEEKREAAEALGLKP